MADKKISALTAATTPLAGTEVLPIVQGGSTVKVSAANLTAGRDISTTGITVSSNTGNIELNWAAGSTHKVGSTFSTTFFTGMRVDADSRNTDIISFDASGAGNVRLRTGVTETTRLNVDPTGNVTVSTGNLVVGTAAKGIDFSANANAPGMTSELLGWYEEGVCSMTVTAIVGVIVTSSVTAIYTRVGRTVTVTGTVTVTLNGTGAGALTVSGLPFTPSGNACGVGRESVNNGKTVSFMVSSGSTAMSVQAYDNTYPVSSGSTILFSVTYTV